MKKIYACLVGEWVCLNDDPNCVMGGDHLSPTDWYESGAKINELPEYSLEVVHKDSYYEYDYVYINYRGIDYRINPTFIQVATLL